MQYKQILLKEVVHFDPYMGLGEEMISKIYAEDDQNKLLSQDLLFELAECHKDKAEEFSHILSSGSNG